MQVYPLNTQKDAVKLMQELLWTAQKLAATLAEAAGLVVSETNPAVFQALYPDVWGNSLRAGILPAMLKYADKAELDQKVEPGDMMNALYLAHRSPAFLMIFERYGAKTLPEPLEALQTMLKMKGD